MRWSVGTIRQSAPRQIAGGSGRTPRGRARLTALVAALVVATVPIAPPVAHAADTSVKVIALDGDTFDHFGTSVAVDGNLMVVGAPDEGDGDEGAAYIYQRRASDGLWILRRKIRESPAAGERFGAAVAVADGTVVVGAPGENGGKGAVHAFRRDAGGTWTGVWHHWYSGDSLANLGAALAFDGRRLVIGGPGAGGAGKVFVRTWDGTTFLGIRSLVPGGETPDGAQWGAAVDLDGDRIIVGAPDWDDGDVTILRYVDGRTFYDVMGTFHEDDADGATSRQLGTSVALSGDHAAATMAYNQFTMATYVERSTGWAEEHRTHGDDEHRIAGPVAMEGNDTIVVGTERWLDNLLADVAVYQLVENPWARPVGTWHLTNRLVDPDARRGDFLGQAVAIDGARVVGGAPEDTTAGGSDAGSVMVFDLDLPYAGNDALTIDEDTTGAIDLTPNDTTSRSFEAYRITGNSGISGHISSDGTATFEPEPDWCGQRFRRYRAYDGQYWTNEASIRITVQCINDAPVAHADVFDGGHHGSTLTVDAPGVLANDTDVDGVDTDADGLRGPGLSVSLIDGPSSGVLDLRADGSFDWTAPADSCTETTFTYRVTDGELSDTAGVTIRCTNATPVAADDAYTTDEDTALVVAVPGVLANDTDTDGDTLTASLESAPLHGTVEFDADGSFTYTPDADFAGTDSFTYQANDGTADSNVATVAITVDPVNDAPTAADDAYSTDEDTALVVAVPGVLGNDADTDGDTLTASLESVPLHGTVELDADGSFTYTPDADFHGTDTFTYHASDGELDSDEATVTITVDPVNDAPTTVDDAYSTDEDTPLVVAVPGVLGNDSDVDGDALSAALVSGPSNGTLTFDADGSFTYTPDPNFHGTDGFTYQASDGTETDTATVTITVEPVNDAPVVVSVSPAGLTVDHSDGIVPVTVTARDVDGDTLILSTSGLPSGVTASNATCTSLADGSNECTWTLSGVVTSPAGVLTGTATVSDGELSDDATVAVTVEAEDATVAPDEANPVAVQVAEDGGASGTFTLSAIVGELVPDQADGTAAPGGLSTAVVSMTLVPVGPGSTVGPISCTNGTVEGTGYDQQLAASCVFDGVEVNTYTVEITVDGGYWTGTGEDVLTVSDPSLGSATGGGTFYWPDTADVDSGYLGDRTNFGFTMSYNKKGTNLRGSLLVIRHLPDGTKYRVKSNALDGLALGEDPTVPMGWASFSGKATYLQPGWDEPEGNHAFTVYVEDRDEPGTGTDRFWLQTRDKNGHTIDAFSLQDPAADHTQPLSGGNIVVPHRQGGPTR